jgi:hypothetical protein
MRTPSNVEIQAGILFVTERKVLSHHSDELRHSEVAAPDGGRSGRPADELALEMIASVEVSTRHGSYATN